MGSGLGSALAALLFPERCVACGGGEELFCGDCRAGLLLLGGALCARCGCPTAWPVERCAECTGRRLAFASARAAVAYDGPARALVRAWKERGLRRAAVLAADLVEDVAPRPAVDALAWVPGDGDRIGWRGGNPAEELARALAARWELPAAALLRRDRVVRPQRGLPRAERRANVRDAFRAAGETPRAVGLVDDVYTTGATTAAAAAALRRGGSRAVHVVAFARTVRR
ncbi:MAG TPA: double zinc ribbon domain-containing protein [Gaiellaceae bacterium]|nr:double zinc ribbon domain-containing protein [Gaiellaceae bacterium]